MSEREKISTREIASALNCYAMLLEAQAASITALMDFDREASWTKVRLIEQEVKRAREVALVLHDLKTHL